MYISRVPLNPARPGAMELLGSPYCLHAAVEHAFPPSSARSTDEGRILWRLDRGPHGGDYVWLYVVSPDKPDFTHVVERAGWRDSEAGAGESKDYAPLLDRLANGQRWAFRLKANPVRKVFCDKGLEANPAVVGTIQAHVTEGQQAAWLLSRAASHGFSVVSGDGGAPLLAVSRRDRSTFAHVGSRVTLVTAVYDGVLEVLDAHRLREALCHGIGRAKGFGCGLLTLAPASGAPL